MGVTRYTFEVSPELGECLAELTDIPPELVDSALMVTESFDKSTYLEQRSAVAGEVRVLFKPSDALVELATAARAAKLNSMTV